MDFPQHQNLAFFSLFYRFFSILCGFMRISFLLAGGICQRFCSYRLPFVTEGSILNEWQPTQDLFVIFFFTFDSSVSKGILDKQCQKTLLCLVIIGINSKMVVIKDVLRLTIKKNGFLDSM